MSRNISKHGPTVEQEPEVRRQINIGFYLHIKQKWTAEQRRAWLDKQPDKEYWIDIAREAVKS